MPDIFIHEQKENKQEKAQDAPEKGPKIHNNLGMLSTFVRNPLGIILQEQPKDEDIVLFIRRDFITNLPWIIATSILLLLPPFLMPFLPLLRIPFTIPGNLSLILFLFYYVIVVGYALTRFATWLYDIGLVTQKRAIDIDFYNLSYVSVATAKLEDLKDVRYAQLGFFQSFFDYGDVALVVEASGETLIFERTPRPAEVVHLLSAVIGGND